MTFRTMWKIGNATCDEHEAPGKFREHTTVRPPPLKRRKLFSANNLRREASVAVNCEQREYPRRECCISFACRELITK